MSTIFPIPPKAAPRFIDPNRPVEEQYAVLRQLIKNPPENTRAITFSPKLAMYLLEHAAWLNRPLRSGKVKLYAAAMAASEWRRTGESIKFSRDGVILDGRHRITACVRAQTAFTAEVNFGLDPEIYKVLDSGAPRSPGDVFASSQIRYPSQAAAAMRWYYILASESPKNRNRLFSNEELLEGYFAMPDPEFRLLLERTVGISKQHKYFPAGSLTGLFFLLKQRDPSATEALLKDIEAGGKGRAKHLIDCLNEIAGNNAGRVHENVRHAKIIICWRSYVLGTTLRPKQLFWDPQGEFPSMNVKKLGVV